MNPTLGFPASLLLTVALLAGVVLTGLRAQRRAHLPLVACAVLSLVATILFAERLGRLYDLQAAGWITPLHLALAKVTAFSFLLPLGTGIATLRRIERLRWHRPAAFLALTLTLLSFVTGVWMVLAAERLEVESSSTVHAQELGRQPR